MALNYDGRLELRFFYTVGGGSDATLNHTHTIDFIPNELSEVEPGAEFSNIVTLHHNGSSSQTLDADVDAYMALLQPFFGDTEANFSRVELWKYGAEPSEDAVFIAVYELDLDGTATGAVQLAGQETFTWRTLGGGVMRTQFMEYAGTEQFEQFTPPYAGSAADLANYLTSTAHPFVGRDNTRPLAGIRRSRSQNEKLFRKRYRP